MNHPKLLVGQSHAANGLDYFEIVAANIATWMAQHDKRILMVTSALDDEGKSFVALNLAASLARGGGRTLLIDADLRRPSLQDSIAPLLDRHTGLDQGGRELANYTTGTSIPLLSFTAATQILSNGAQLPTGQRIREFLELVKRDESIRYVVMDAPAALVSAEAQVMAGLAEAVLLVVAANRTSRNSVRKALQTFKGAAVAGVVMNLFKPSHTALQAQRRANPRR